MAYVTKAEFDRSPLHAIDTSDLVPGGTDEENALALSEILEAATAMVNEFIDMDTLEATEGTVERFDTHMNRRFEVRLSPKNRPINAVTGVRYRTAGSTSWTTVGSSSIELSGRSVTVVMSQTLSVAGQALPYASYSLPSEIDRLTKVPLVVEVTYNHGYATIPQDVKTATILFAASLIKQRGSSAVEMDGSPSVMGGNPYDRGDEDRARELLRRYR